MHELGKVHQLIIPAFGHNMVFNLETIFNTWAVMLILLAIGIITTRKRRRLPHSFQVFGELLVGSLYDLTEDALDKERAEFYAPLTFALFLFLLLSNWIGIIPIFHEPTKDLNTPLSLGIMGFVIAHTAGIRAKGIKTYLKEYCEPIFLMAPLNIIGELAKIVSISFRLFGNIMGGVIIIIVVSYLSYSVLLPPFLNAFFGLFVGTIQAFVFTMLTVVYIAVQVK